MANNCSLSKRNKGGWKLFQLNFQALRPYVDPDGIRDWRMLSTGNFLLQNEGWAHEDEGFLGIPKTGIPLLVGGNWGFEPPFSHSNGKCRNTSKPIQPTNYTFQFVNSPIAHLSKRAKWRFEEPDKNSPVSVFRAFCTRKYHFFLLCTGFDEDAVSLVHLLHSGSMLD